MGQIVQKFVNELVSQLAERKVTIELSDEARDYFAAKGYDPIYGARPLARVIQGDLKRPLSEEILFGKLEKGGNVLVDVMDGKLTFDFGQHDAADAAAGSAGAAKGETESEPEPVDEDEPVTVL